MERPWKCPRMGCQNPFLLQPGCLGELLLTPSPALDKRSLAIVFSNSFMRKGEGKRLGLEFDSFPSWRGSWSRRGSASLRSTGKAPVLHGWSWQLIHTSIVCRGHWTPKPWQAPSYSSSSGAPALPFHKTGAVLSPVNNLSQLPASHARNNQVN